MHRVVLALFALIIGFTLPMHDAEAKRFGGGKSSGMQRQAPQAPMKRDATPQQGQTPPAQAPNATPGKRSWMGPIAGLAAGLGLAALFSHFGMGAEMANFLMIALLVLAVGLLIRWVLMRSQSQAAHPMAYAGHGPTPVPAPAPARFDTGAPLPGSPAAMSQTQAAFPPGFDATAFERQAKVNFIRLQAAHDAGNLDDIREFTTPEMYAEIKLDLNERGAATGRTEVDQLDAQVLEAIEEEGKHIVSVRFSGVIREDGQTSAPFDEVWHLTRPASGKGGWVVAGIQQNG
jgi:predicted lipid-binding transport protein (Tim44 family)